MITHRVFIAHAAVHWMYTTLTRRAPSLLLSLPHAPASRMSLEISLPSYVFRPFSFTPCQPFDWFYDFSYKAMTTYHAISLMCALFHSESRIGLALSAFIPSFLPVIKALYLFRPSTVVPRLSARSNTPGIVPSHGPDPNTS